MCTNWQDWIAAYQSQLLKADKVIVIDSSSSDNTAEHADESGFLVHSIPKSEFNHGGTRNQAVEFAKSFADVVVFMTQDAILASPDSLALGIKTAFMSNSFAAYRLSVFDKLGGFPDNTILAEDMYLAAKMILSGYKVAYCAEATVFHSHNYTLKQEFQRYFDTGVFQQEQKWIQQKFGSAASEGKRFVLSELKFLSIKSPHLIPKAILSTCVKWLGFKLGYYYYRLPYKWCRVFSMHKGYWDKVT